MSTLRKLPFTLEKGEFFKTKSNDWIGDVFYNILPDAGYEIREEQIYTAFHMFQSLTKRELLLAEAGLGTGKTFAYLIGSLLYSRHIGRPVIISCGSSSLVDQLLHPDGDIAKLSRALGVDIDARAALDETQYMCIRKVQDLRLDMPDEPGINRLLDWAETTKYGFRFEVPDVPDELWNQIRRDDHADCGECHVKFRCPFIRSREYYRHAGDLIVCTHSFYFKHVRSRHALREQGHLPLLPPYAAVILDEAHQVEDEARRAMGEQLLCSRLLNALERLATVQTRESFALLLDDILEETEQFFALLDEQQPPRYVKTPVCKTAPLMHHADKLYHLLIRFLDELSIEEGLTNTGHTDYSLARRKAWVQVGRMETVLQALLSDIQQDHHVVWLERSSDEETWDEVSLWVAPFHIDRIMQTEVFQENLPVIFSSATLAQGDSFDYAKQSLGASEANISQVPSPFDYEEQCIVHIPAPQEPALFEQGDPDPVRITEQIVQLLQITGGRALVLFQNEATMNAVKQAWSALVHRTPWTLFWEGGGTTSHLLRQFRENETSVLLGLSYWEGISIPGPALSQCIIAELPFFGDDPLMLMKRQQAEKRGQNPFLTVDVPEMLIRLRQGAGRLIRSQTDYGIISCIDTRFRGTPYEPDVLQAFPAEAKWIDDPEQVAAQYAKLQQQ